MGIEKKISDSVWDQISPLFPQSGPQDAASQRLFFEAVVYVLSNGCRWRALPAGYGLWNSVFVRYNRYSKAGVWERIFKALSPATITELQLDSTIVKAHRHAAGAPKKRAPNSSAKAGVERAPKST